MIENKLQKICRDVQESLRFAEAKNGALITFNGAALYVMVEGHTHIHPVFQKYWQINAMFLILAITIALIAFLPSFGSKTKPVSKIDLEKWHARQAFGIYYFGHIRLYGAEEYLAKVYHFHNKELTEPIPRIELDLAKQAITLARITRHKYVFFSLAGHITLIGLVLPIPVLLIYRLLVYLNRYTETDMPV
jgi:hypothetical protein